MRRVAASELTRPAPTSGPTKSASIAWNSSSPHTASTNSRSAVSYPESGSIHDVWTFASLLAFSM